MAGSQGRGPARSPASSRESRTAAGSAASPSPPGAKGGAQQGHRVVPVERAECEVGAQRRPGGAVGEVLDEGVGGVLDAPHAGLPEYLFGTEGDRVEVPGGGVAQLAHGAGVSRAGRWWPRRERRRGPGSGRAGRARSGGSRTRAGSRCAGHRRCRPRGRCGWSRGRGRWPRRAGSGPPRRRAPCGRCRRSCLGRRGWWRRSRAARARRRRSPWAGGPCGGACRGWR